MQILTKAKIENQRTLDMFIISKNIINDRGEINTARYDNHYVNERYGLSSLWRKPLLQSNMASLLLFPRVCSYDAPLPALNTFIKVSLSSVVNLYSCTDKPFDFWFGSSKTFAKGIPFFFSRLPWGVVGPTQIFAFSKKKVMKKAMTFDWFISFNSLSSIVKPHECNVTDFLIKTSTTT